MKVATGKPVAPLHHPLFALRAQRVSCSARRTATAIQEVDMMQEKRPIRKKRLRVPVLPDEEAAIKKMAVSTGLPVAVFLRNVSLGYQVRSILDHKAVEELVRINGDLGRLGGLLKLWLADDPRAAHYGERLIRALLLKIEDTRDQMHGIMQTVVMQRPGR